jgi:hypothetical protein
MRGPRKIEGLVLLQRQCEEGAAAADAFPQA